MKLSDFKSGYKLDEALRAQGVDVPDVPYEIDRRYEQAIELAEGALIGDEARRAIWTDAD
jgi:hypothetical protein